MAIRNEPSTPDSFPSSTPPLQIDESSYEDDNLNDQEFIINFFKHEQKETPKTSLKLPIREPGPDKLKLDAFLNSIENIYLSEISIGCRLYVLAESSNDLISASRNFDSIHFSHMPPDIFEDELLPLFHKIDKVLKFKLITNCETGFSKGYGFVHYVNPDSINKAIREVTEFYFYLIK
jgi:RNA recognition motif-containing protein